MITATAAIYTTIQGHFTGILLPVVILNRYYCQPLGSAARLLQISPETPIRNFRI
jgi:hypothetical protein